MVIGFSLSHVCEWGRLVCDGVYLFFIFPHNSSHWGSLVFDSWFPRVTVDVIISQSNPIQSIHTYIHTYHLRTPRKARILINTQDYAMLLKPLHLPVSSRQCRCSHPALPNPTFPSHLPTVHSLRSTYSAHLAFPSLSCFFSKSLEESTYH